MNFTLTKTNKQAVKLVKLHFDFGSFKFQSYVQLLFVSIRMNTYTVYVVADTHGREFGFY